MGSGLNTVRLSGFGTIPSRHRHGLKHDSRAIHGHVPRRGPIMAGCIFRFIVTAHSGIVTSDSGHRDRGGKSQIPAS